MSTQLAEPFLIHDTDTDEATESDPGKCAHIVKTDGTRSAQAIVLEARVMGLEVEALCGYKWVPSKDPENLPVCPKCKEILELHQMFDPTVGGAKA